MQNYPKTFYSTTFWMLREEKKETFCIELYECRSEWNANITGITFQFTLLQMESIETENVACCCLYFSKTLISILFFIFFHSLLGFKFNWVWAMVRDYSFGQMFRWLGVVWCGQKANKITNMEFAYKMWEFKFQIDPLAVRLHRMATEMAHRTTCLHKFSNGQTTFYMFNKMHTTNSRVGLLEAKHIKCHMWCEPKNSFQRSTAFLLRSNRPSHTPFETIRNCCI